MNLKSLLDELQRELKSREKVKEEVQKNNA